MLNVRDNILCRKFHMCSVPVKLKLFTSYCSSLYTPHLWWNYKKMSVTNLQVTFHNILKRNIGLSEYDSTSATCAFTNTQCCQSTIRNIVFKCMCIYIYNSILTWQHAILKSGARTPRTVTKFAVKIAIALTQTI